MVPAGPALALDGPPITGAPNILVVRIDDDRSTRAGVDVGTERMARSSLTAADPSGG